MLFNSFDFILFFVVVWILYIILNRKAQNFLLMSASLFFYGYWDLKFLGLMLASAVIDYLCTIQIARKIEQGQKSNWFGGAKLYLWISIVFNLGILITFKSYHFFTPELQKILLTVFNKTSPDSLQIIIPAGISFYTFQLIAYVVDVYKDEQKAVKNIIDFTLFVSFFPQLLSGPIERAKNLVTQIQKDRVINQEAILNGIGLLTFGFFQKVVVADNLTPFFNMYLGSPQETNTGMIFLIVYLGVIRFYCDFAGYSNIARGLGSLLGFRLSVNFRNPLLATSPAKVWRRWHITLTQWFYRYFFLPLVEKLRRFNLGNYCLPIALLVTTGLVGLWHGFELHHFIWGLAQGILYVIYHFIGKLGKKYNIKVPVVIAVLVWFHLLGFSGFFNVINDISEMAIHYKSFMNGLGPINMEVVYTLLYFGGILFTIEIMHERNGERFFFANRSPLFRLSVISFLFFIIISAGVLGERPFVYFQF